MVRQTALAAVLALMASSAHAAKIGDVFVIAMENQNSSVSGTNTSGLNPIYGNSAAPYINSLITPGNPNAALTSYSSAYHDIVYQRQSADPGQQQPVPHGHEEPRHVADQCRPYLEILSGRHRFHRREQFHFRGDQHRRAAESVDRSQ